MYRIYYTDPKQLHLAEWQDVSELTNALQCCEYLRKHNMIYVTMVSDYENMVGKSGASGIDSNYVPQMLN